MQLMKRARIDVNAFRTAAASGAQSQSMTNVHKENDMKTKKQPAVRKPSRKIADQRRIRFGGGCAPAKLARAADAAIADAGAIRFGGGCAPAALRK